MCEYFGATEGLTVDCKVTCVCEGFVFLGVVNFGRIGECLSFCSDISNCLCVWCDYKIVFFVIYFTIV